MRAQWTGPARRIAVALALLAITIVVVPARADTKAQIEATRAKIDELVGRIASQAQLVARLQGEATDLLNDIGAVEDGIAENKNELARLGDEIDLAEEAMAGLQVQLDQRAADLYSSGGGTALEILLGAATLDEFSARAEFMRQAAQQDRDLIEEVANRRSELETKQLERERLAAELAGRQENLEGQYRVLSDKFGAAQEALAGLNADKAEADRLLSQLEDQRERELEAARIAAAERAAREAQEAQDQQNQGGGTPPPPGPPQPGGGGSNPFQVCPVDQPRAYADTYGAPRYVGGYHPHKGIDIMAPQGVPIRAPFAGNATNASNEYGGLAVMVHGSKGSVYNAHLSAIGTLGSVSAGTIIGYVGHTGSASGGANHDHFEWRPNVIPPNPWVSPYGYSQIEDTIDPFPFLNQVC